MTEYRFVTIKGVEYPVLISDEYEALQAALAAGRAVIELIGDGPMSGAPFGAERLEEIDSIYLERVVRRNLKLPWIIGETERLLIREFCLEDRKDIIREPEDGEDDRAFYTEDRLASYIRNQYTFYQYGIWALVDKKRGILVGMAGLTDKTENKRSSDGGRNRENERNYEIEWNRENEWNREIEDVRLEIGYHIFKPYRRKGYAKEACLEILKYADAWIGRNIWAEIEPENQASISLIKSLDFELVNRRYNGKGQCSFLYFRNSKTGK
ncbi:GNAT family N-acetyltransferase [Clostridium sp. MCC353]|uniref:GNAT family N-acetyltransferase n=1 Tax=Clostridium sp. MCC353 TaxID=2592646 RepID=UPI001C0333ED|nr:GNAT family N-acetyltransferase [Clostridium sp. MCC353]MBT9777175.1 GNAT family N-acetyltransferase [Clostridium sp. MCC353]